MNRLRYILSNIRESIRSHPIAYLVIFVAAIVAGCISTIVYNFAMYDIGDITMATATNYEFRDRAMYGKVDPHSNLDDYAPLCDIMREKELYANKHKPLDRVTSITASFNVGDGVQNGMVALCWDEELFDTHDIDSGAKVVVLSTAKALLLDVSVGDAVEVYGNNLRVVSIVDSDIDIAIPYTTRLDNLRNIIYEDIEFTTHDRLTSDEMAVFLQYTEPPNVNINEIKPTEWIFIFVTLVGVINVLISTIYVAKRAGHKYSIARMLGASNVLTGIAMMTEICVFTALGVLVGFGIAFGVLYGTGIIQYSHNYMNILDMLFILGINLVVTVLVAIVFVIRRFIKSPVEE